MEPGIKTETIHESANCRAVADVLARVGDKWTVYVVKLLANGSMRFNEIRRAIPAISQRMLSLTLRGLERDGLVTRTVTPSIPPRVDYALTQMGHTLIEPLKAIGTWALANRDYVEISRAQFDARPENATTTEFERRKRKPALMVRDGATSQKPTHSEL